MICLGVLYLFIPLVVTEFLESENWHISFVLETFSHYLFIYCSASLSLSYPPGIPISYVRSPVSHLSLTLSALLFPFSILIVLQFECLLLTCLLFTKPVLSRLNKSKKFLVLDIFFNSTGFFFLGRFQFSVEILHLFIHFVHSSFLFSLSHLQHFKFLTVWLQYLDNIVGWLLLITDHIFMSHNFFIVCWTLRIKNHGDCYGLNCVSCKFVCWSPNSQCDYLERGALRR